jgi:hypothetical protein
VSRLYSLVNVSKVEPLNAPGKHVLLRQLHLFTVLYTNNTSPLLSAGHYQMPLYCRIASAIRSPYTQCASTRVTYSEHTASHISHRTYCIGSNTAYQNTISVYYIYKLHAYYAYNERSLAYNDYYAYIDLVCIRLYVFLLADLYAKRYVTHQTICIVHSARAAICI